MSDDVQTSGEAAPGAAHRLWVAPGSLVAGVRAVDGESYHYLFRVRRARVGDSVELFDGRGLTADAVVRAIDAERAVLEVAAPRRVTAAGCRITVAQALIKGERMDYVVQKLAELGVDAIAPITTERAVVRLDAARSAKRRARFADIAREAARQSGRATVPDIEPIADLERFLAARAPSELALILSTDQTERPLAAALPQRAPASLCLLIGPEGGFARHEVEACAAAGFISVGLGPHVLRAETAAVAVVAAIKFAFGQVAD